MMTDLERLKAQTDVLDRIASKMLAARSDKEAVDIFIAEMTAVTEEYKAELNKDR